MKRDRRVKEASTDTAIEFWVAVFKLEPEYRKISQLALIHVNAWLRTKYLIINNNN